MLIARFSAMKAASIAVVIFVPTIAFGWLVSISQRDVSIFKGNGGVLGLIVLAAVAAMWFVYRIGAIFFQILFRQGSAIWSDGGNLIFTNRFIWRIGLTDIDSVSAGVFSYLGLKFKTVNIYLRNGTRRTISTGLLQETQAQIISELKVVLKK